MRVVGLVWRVGRAGPRRACDALPHKAAPDPSPLPFPAVVVLGLCFFTLVSALRAPVPGYIEGGVGGG